MGGKPQRNGAGGREPAQRDRTDGTELGPVLEFMGALWTMDHALQSASKRMEARHGVTGPQRLVIRIVGRFPGISAGELAAILHLHPSTLTGVLKRLAGRGLIERVADPGDARRALLRLTRRGRELNALKSGTVEHAVRRALAQVEPRTVSAARALAGAIAAELDRLG
ncbi:MarR family winged helix-turn-helix transcriptional regulator [Anaeromyxobacter sp. PSR-1]|uniref:MarR family winged helix-turn-helix transcriptional regulator n=1 Tax=unclassified Anaeromyxobacter TaxID=2620896 RepID=UPI0005E6D666|nr:MarR family transcriptional regulator [Anaeromyxobacter sp. PSR-1]GAO04911.1 marR family protein [Anaeromyxobacter sp. PSR-1]